MTGRLFILVLLLGWGHVAQAASFRATLEPDTIYQGQGATLALTFEGGQPDSLPTLPRVPNLTYGGGGREDRMTFANGKQSSSTTYRYSVLPSQPGTYTIPPIVVQFGGQPMVSEPLRLTVVSAAQAVQRGNQQPTRALLRIHVPRTNLFVGEVLPVELTIYAINPSAFDIAPLEAEGFTVGKSERTEQSRVPLNGMIYTRVGIRTTVTPGKAGTLKLGPATGRVQVEVPVARRRTGDPFEEFFNDPFFNRTTESQVLNVVSEPVTVEVRPLPTEDAPPSFLGAVGQFALEIRAAPTNVAVGEPVHLRIQVSGRGALETLAGPSLEGAKDFRVYPANSRVETTDTLGVEGSKIFEQDIVPENAAVRQVPPVIYTFFDPVNTRYVSLTNPAIPLIVRPTGQARTLAGPASEEPVPKEIVHLKPRLGSLAALSAPVVTRPWFLALQLVPILAWLGALLLRKRREHLSRNPRSVRRHQVQRFVKSGLVELKQHASQGRAEEFFAVLVKLLQEVLGEKLNLPSASITEAVIEERLRPKGLRPEVLAEMHGLFQACNQARYAPSGSVEDLQQAVTRFESVVQALREVESE